MMEIVHFSGLFLETNIVFGAIVAAFLLGRNDRLQLPEWPLVITGFALGPLVTTLLLYYAMVLWHGIPALLLQSLPLLFFAALVMWSGDGLVRLWELVTGLPRLFRDRSMRWFLAGSLLLLGITALLLHYKPLVDHDVLEYATQGRVFLRDLAITYQRVHHDAATGFHYVGLHGFSFPLLFTWERLNGSMLGTTGDLWSRSITGWYAWLLLAFVWSLARRTDPRAALPAAIALAAPLGFVLLLTVYHLDSYRLFFFTATVAVFIAALQAPSRERMLLLGVLGGAQAFIHSIGMILSGTLWVLCVLMLPTTTGDRLRWSAVALAAMLVAGAIHYVLDVLWGTGWLLQDIRWF